MDFSKLNVVARSGLRDLKRIFELELNRLYEIEEVKKVMTKYGEKFVVYVKDNMICFLLTRVSNELLSDKEAGLIEFQERLTTTLVSLRRLDGPYNSIEFVVSLSINDSE